MKRTAVIRAESRMHAISIRQPYAEQILLGLKSEEYRSRITHIRGRVYLYASKGRGDPDGFRALGMEPGELPVGVIVGTVEIVNCKYCKEGGGYYSYELKHPERLREPLIPKNHPQPCWFYPF